MYTAVTRAAKSLIIKPTDENVKITPEELDKQIEDVVKKTTTLQEGDSQNNNIKTVSEEYGVETVDTFLSKAKEQEFTDIIQKQIGAIREFIFSDISQAYNSDSITLLSEHLIGTPLQIEAQRESEDQMEGYLYLINSDGHTPDRDWETG